MSSSLRIEIAQVSGSTNMFNTGKRHHKRQGKKQAKLEKYYAKYFKWGSKKVKENEATPPVSSTTSEDNTMNDVTSLPTSKGITPMEDTDRQLADCFLLSDYQRLLSEKEEEETQLQESHSYPKTMEKTALPEKQNKSEPPYHPNVTLRKPRNVSLDRIGQLEKEIARLKDAVKKQGIQLVEIRKEIDQLLVEHNGKTVKKTIKYNSEPLIATENPDKAKDHFTCYNGQ